MHIVFNNRLVMYETKYPKAIVKVTPRELLFPYVMNDLPVNMCNKNPINVITSITNEKMAKILKYKQYDFGRGP